MMSEIPCLSLSGRFLFSEESLFSHLSLLSNKEEVKLKENKESFADHQF